jgi:hypothetical protein
MDQALTAVGVELGGEVVLLRVPRWARLTKLVVVGYSIACALVLAALLRDFAREPDDLGLMVSSVLVALTGAGLARDSLQRQWQDEWWLGPGWCIHRQRRGHSTRTLGQVVGFDLMLAAGVDSRQSFRLVARTVDDDRVRNELLLVSFDLFEARCLALWLERATGLPLR